MKYIYYVIVILLIVGVGWYISDDVQPQSSQSVTSDDVVLEEGDSIESLPLEDITATRGVEAVINRGVLLTREQLNALVTVN